MPTSWMSVIHRCKVPPTCYGAGDFQTVASNPYKSASTPFIQQSSHQNDLFQNFVEDSPAQPSVDTFVPNTIWFPLGTDISARGVEAVSDASPAGASLPYKGRSNGSSVACCSASVFWP